MHPCHIKKIIEIYPLLKADEEINKDESLHLLINSLFNLGRSNIIYNTNDPHAQRCIYMLLNFARHIIVSRHNNELHEIVSSKNLFRQLFLMIYNAQECNRNFTRETIKIILTHFLDFLHDLEKMQVLVHQFNKKDYSQSDEAAEESKSDGFASEQEEEEIDQAVPLMNSIKTMLNKLKERYESSYGKE